MHSRPAIGIAAAGAIFVLSAVRTNEAQEAPLPYGWTPIGQVILDKAGCTACPATFLVTNRYVYFGLATDTPYPILLAGQFDVKCIDGSGFHNFLNSPVRGGVFQIVQNSCVNYETHSVTLSTTTVGLSPPDNNRSVVLTVYGIVHSTSLRQNDSQPRDEQREDARDLDRM